MVQVLPSQMVDQRHMYAQPGDVDDRTYVVVAELC
jgi:hypothetical protein